MKTLTTSLCVLALVFHAGCSGSSSSPPPPAPNAAPADCKQTMCDFQYNVCETTQTQASSADCTNCWSACSPDNAVDCASACGDICQSTSASSDPCPSLLDSCRQSPTNHICSDDFGDPAPDGQPCNADLSAAACVCGHDYVCLGALMATNSACAKCNGGSWQTTCLMAACPGQLAEMQSCMQANRCTSFVSCPCGSQLSALNACLNSAEADPFDQAGCYSGAHACWVNPVCPPSS